MGTYVYWIKVLLTLIVILGVDGEHCALQFSIFIDFCLVQKSIEIWRRIVFVGNTNAYKFCNCK